MATTNKIDDGSVSWGSKANSMGLQRRDLKSVSGVALGSTSFTAIATCNSAVENNSGSDWILVTALGYFHRSGDSNPGDCGFQLTDGTNVLAGPIYCYCPTGFAFAYGHFSITAFVNLTSGSSLQLRLEAAEDLAGKYTVDQATIAWGNVSFGP